MDIIDTIGHNLYITWMTLTYFSVIFFASLCIKNHDSSYVKSEFNGPPFIQYTVYIVECIYGCVLGAILWPALTAALIVDEFKKE